MNKVATEAPHIYDLSKRAAVSLQKSGLDPKKYKAAVVATVDHSGSTEWPDRLLYTRGTMQEVVDIAFAAGVLFDDDGEVPVSLFSNYVSELGNMNLGNCRGFMDRHRRYPFGGTDYVAALEWIVEQAGFGRELRSMETHAQHRGLFHRSPKLQLLATAEYPTYAIFATDGEPNPGTESAIEQLLTQMSQLPIFVQFVGVGNADFKFLQELDTMDGRLVDNANFFDAKDVGHDQNRMLEAMLSEFPDYYHKAGNLGLVTTR